MIFMENLNNKVYTFVKHMERNVLKQFIVGFYQLINKEIHYSSNFDVELIDRKRLTLKVVDYFENITSIEDEVKKSTATEEMALFLTYMAHMYASLMEIEKSLPLYLESVKIREKYLGVKHLLTAENYQGIGAIYEQGGAFNYALQYYGKALVLRKELAYVENDLLVAESYSRLALVYYHLEQYPMALDYMEKSIKIREKVLSSEHTLLQNSYYNYKIIKKESQPKKDYIKVILEPINKGIGAFINRLIG